VRYGHIKLSRKQMNGRDLLWEDGTPFDSRSAWVYLLFKAAWKPSDYRTGNRVDHLERGEFVASLRYLAERWGWSKDRVRRFLQLLTKARRIAPQKRDSGRDSHGTVYLILNYDSYQTTDDPRATPDASQTRQLPPRNRDKVEAVKQYKQGEGTLGARPDAWVDRFAVEWEALIGMASKPKLLLHLSPLVRDHGVPQVFAAWQGYLREGQGKPWVAVTHFANTYLAIRDRWSTTTDEAGKELRIPSEPGRLEVA
jgi:hypothetical protein